jgi:histidinol-phosphate aminotransferase
MVFICNPNNPTGTIVKNEEIEFFMDKVPDSVLVVFDEAYGEYAEISNYVSGLKYVKKGRNAVVLKTFSKIYGLAGLRVGYGLTHPEIANTVARATIPFSVNSLAQVAALAALDDIEHVNRSKEINSVGKQYLYQEFEKMNLNYVPTEANFIFVNTGKHSQEVFKAMLQKGVIIRTGDNFGFPDFIRVTVGTQAENQRFIQSLKQVLDY